MGIIIALLVFSLMIFLHELGHFVAARCCHVTVEEFAIGMGPKILSHKSKKSGTVYSWRLFPIGGFTAMKGENEDSEDEHAFNSRPWWQRLIVLLAGALTNIITAFIVMAIVVSTQSFYGSTTIYDFTEPKEGVVSSQETGLMPGDTIIKLGDRDIHIWTELAYAVVHDGIEPIDVTVIRNGKTLVVEDVVFPTAVQDGVVGGTVDFRVYRLEKTFSNVVKQTFYQSFSYVKWVYEGLFDLISGRYGMEAVSGPVGVVEVIGDTVQTENGLSYLPTLFVLISINLGVVNLLPLPALDGGRILFVLIEAIRRKKIKPEKEAIVHFIGLALLLGLIIVISVFDIVDLFR